MTITPTQLADVARRLSSNAIGSFGRQIVTNIANGLTPPRLVDSDMATTMLRAHDDLHRIKPRETGDLIQGVRNLATPGTSHAQAHPTILEPFHRAQNAAERALARHHEGDLSGFAREINDVSRLLTRSFQAVEKQSLII